MYECTAVHLRVVPARGGEGYSVDGESSEGMAVQSVWTEYDKHARLVKKNSANKSLKESKAAIAKLMEEQPDAHCWESTSSIWDAATTKRRQELEKHARGNSSHQLTRETDDLEH
jgi:hypothetical protein